MRLGTGRRPRPVVSGSSTRGASGGDAAPFAVDGHRRHPVAVGLQVTDRGQPERVFSSENQ